MAEVTARILRLLALLRTGRPYSGEELAARLGVPARTLGHDILWLRDLGYPVETRPGPRGYYRLGARAAEPPAAYDNAAAREGPAARPGPEVAEAVITTLAGAIDHRTLVTFGYVKPSGQARVRHVEPYRQVHLNCHWYLMGWDRDRRGWRVFRLDRMHRLRETTSTFAPRPLAAGSALAHLRHGSDRDRLRVILVVAAPLLTVADIFRHLDAEFEQVGDGIVTTVIVDTWPQLLPGLAFLDAAFTIVEPEAPRTDLRRHGERHPT